MYYIQNKERGYVGNCILWWRKKDSGYSTKLSQAKKFSKKEAKEICGNNKGFVMWKCKYTEDRAELTVDMQDCGILDVGSC